MELVKRLTGYNKATGDLFAVIAPLGLAPGRVHRLQGQFFHVYLIVYGLFRFAHEYFRDTPRLVDGISGYHLLAMGIFLLGLVRYVQRARVPTSNLV